MKYAETEKMKAELSRLIDLNAQLLKGWLTDAVEKKGERLFVTGKWLPYKNGTLKGLSACSNCGRLTLSKMNYCPHCGAKMENPDL